MVSPGADSFIAAWIEVYCPAPSISTMRVRASSAGKSDIMVTKNARILSLMLLLLKIGKGVIPSPVLLSILASLLS
jgi:hypothetical protein